MRRELAGVTHFLRPLVLLRRRSGDRGHREADEVAIVRRIPVPIAIRGCRGHAAAADRPVDCRRGAAHVLIGLPAGVGVGDAIERVVAGRRVAEVGNDLRPLAIRRPQCRRHAGDDLRVALRTLSRVIDADVHDHRLRRHREQLSADADVVQGVGLTLGRRVVDESVAARARERHTPGDLAAQRTGDRRLGLEEVVAAVADFDVAFAREVRPAARDVDRAGGRVLAEERALWSAQHFDLRDVEEVEGGGRRASVEDPVDVEADARLDAVVSEPERRPDTADRHRRVARIRRVELHRRDQLLHAIHVEGAGALDERAAQHRHRDRHFLHHLFDATRGHDDALGEARRAQGEVGRCRRPGADHHLANRGLEPVERSLEPIRTGRDARTVGALTVGDCVKRGTARLVDDFHRDAGEWRVAGIPDDAGDRRRCPALGATPAAARLRTPPAQTDH